MSFELADLPKGSSLRARAIAAYAAGEQAKISSAPAPATTRRPRRVARASCTWECARCSVPLPTWAACSRHGDTTGHPRFAVVLDPPEGHRQETGNG